MVLFHRCPTCDPLTSRVFIIVSNFSTKNYTINDSVKLTENANCQLHYNNPELAYKDCFKLQIKSPKSFYGVALIDISK